MEKASVIMGVMHFIECPHCHNSKSRIDHLFSSEGKETSWGDWFCDECGGAYKGVVKGKDVFVEKSSGRKDDSIVFLKKGNVLLAVKGRYSDGVIDIERDRHFYNEHTCPVNYFRDVEMVIDLENGDRDPHGIFEYVGTIPHINLDEVEDISSVFRNASAQKTIK